MFGLFSKKEEAIEPVDDEAVVAPAEGDMFPIDQVKDEVFAQKMMGDGVAFRYAGNRIALCAPANGILSVLFPTGHAYGITMNNGVELLVHIGLDTVNANGEGFTLCGKKQGDAVKAGEPIVEVNLRKLGKTYDMSTMLVVTSANNHEIHFIEPRHVTKGQRIIK
jgi:PTS system glucose-specific IIA component